MSRRVHLLLFDVDGTLILSGGAGARALSEAFHGLFGVPDAMGVVDAHGKTDHIICQEMFRAHLGREGTAEECRLLLGKYVEALPRCVAESAGYRLMPGVPELLGALSRRRDVALGLGTGNVERGARIKLDRGGLNPYFPFGGFGSDAVEREDVLETGFRRGEARIRSERPAAEVLRWVVGDTWRDIEAGRACGARTVAVATGGEALEELAAAGPDHLFPDFAEDARLPALLDGAM